LIRELLGVPIPLLAPVMTTTLSLIPSMKFYLLRPLNTASKRDRNAQEGCRNGGGILARAFVLAGKQLFQLSLQISRSAVLFRGFECIHGRPVVFPEFIDEG
jgi:hypothetical protein